jgi:hypothetical protein
MTEQTPADAYIESCLIDLSKQLTAATRRIEILELELAEERHSREVAAKHAWRFSDALHKIKDMQPDPEFGMVPIDTAREVARRALEGKE